MKIGFILFDYFSYGGLQRDCRRTAEVCADRGHQVTLFTRTWQGEPPMKVTVRLLQRNGITNISRNRRFFKQLAQELPRHSLDGVVGFNRAPNLDVYFAADPCYEAKISSLKPFWYRWLPRYHHFRNLEWMVFQQGSKPEILLLTDHEIPLYQKYYQTEIERFHLLPPGINRWTLSNEERTNTRRRVFAEQKWKGEDLLLLFVGSDFKRKGLDRIIRGLAALPDTDSQRYRLAVVGDDSPNAFARLASKLGVQHSVHFFGGRDDVRDFFTSADLLVHPARSEAAGMVLLEALVTGLPVLTSKVCGYASHVQKAKAGKVLDSPFDQKDFDHQLATILKRKETLEIWRQNALDYANREDLYSCHQKAVDIIEKVILKKLNRTA